jgi:VIT1/CCC1 family predicted Fe2+/Mn2+ transporter
MEPLTPVDPWQPTRTPTMNAMATLAIVFAFLFFPLGILFGHIAKRQIARTGETGAGLATTALVISYLILGLAVCACCGGLYLWGPDSR